MLGVPGGKTAPRHVVISDQPVRLNTGLPDEGGPHGEGQDQQEASPEPAEGLDAEVAEERPSSSWNVLAHYMLRQRLGCPTLRFLHGRSTPCPFLSIGALEQVL